MSFDLLDPNMAVIGAGLELGTLGSLRNWAPRVHAVLRAVGFCPWNLGPCRKRKILVKTEKRPSSESRVLFLFLRDQDIFIRNHSFMIQLKLNIWTKSCCTQCNRMQDLLGGTGKTQRLSILIWFVSCMQKRKKNWPRMSSWEWTLRVTDLFWTLLYFLSKLFEISSKVFSADCPFGRCPKPFECRWRIHTPWGGRALCITFDVINLNVTRMCSISIW